METRQILKEIISQSIPAFAGSLLGFLQETINLIFIGHLNDPAKIAAVGMGNMIINLCAIGVFLGLNSGLDTLVSQAYGAKKMRLCVLYLQRGRMILLLIIIPIVCIFLNTEKFLKSFGQDQNVAYYAA